MALGVEVGLGPGHIMLDMDPAPLSKRGRAPIFGTSLANVNSRSRSLYAVARPSVVCLSVVGNARAPYSDGSNFRQYFYGI